MNAADSVLHTFCIRDVHDDAADIMAFHAQVFHGFCGHGFIEIGDDDAGASLGQCGDAGQTDVLCAAGDDGDAVIEAEFSMYMGCGS